ncbi:hypothetical protein [Massilia sp. NP310]|uniref:hypothetical protein n=1 Tax=Massilia sp. NP310 TaxID=2861282 RepID=UPI001C632632|nr:hypothetical protein [Massilia sp. NP310]QYG03994.1 hypothetical protein KY496_11750 [Massilia sp. NP310]
MKRMSYAMACLCVLLTGCQTTPVSVTVDAIRRPLPEQAMRVDEPLDMISTGSREELEMWVAKAAEQFGMCVADKAELVDWILKERAANATK